MIMQESTYSSLSEPYFNAVRQEVQEGPNGSTNHLETYKSLLKHIKLQSQSREDDIKSTNERIAVVEKEIESLDAILRAKVDEYHTLKSEVDKKRGLVQMAKHKFEVPIDIHLDDRRVSVTLNKAVSQLKVDSQTLEDEIAELQARLNTSLVEFDRRFDVLKDLNDTVIEFKERFENPDATAKPSRSVNDDDDDDDAEMKEELSDTNKEEDG